MVKKAPPPAPPAVPPNYTPPDALDSFFASRTLTVPRGGGPSRADESISFGDLKIPKQKPPKRLTELHRPPKRDLFASEPTPKDQLGKMGSLARGDRPKGFKTVAQVQRDFAPIARSFGEGVRDLHPNYKNALAGSALEIRGNTRTGKLAVVIDGKPTDPRLAEKARSWLATGLKGWECPRLLGHRPGVFDERNVELARIPILLREPTARAYD